MTDPEHSTHACPLAERVADYASGALAPGERAGAEAHFVECDECRRSLALCVRLAAAVDIDPAHEYDDLDAFEELVEESRARAAALVRRLTRGRAE